MGLFKPAERVKKGLDTGQNCSQSPRNIIAQRSPMSLARHVNEAFQHPATQASMLSIASLSWGHIIPVLAGVVPIIYYGLSTIFLVIDRVYTHKERAHGGSADSFKDHDHNDSER